MSLFLRLIKGNFLKPCPEAVPMGVGCLRARGPSMHATLAKVELQERSLSKSCENLMAVFPLNVYWWA